MQDTAWVAAHLADLLATGQQPLMKFEIYVDTSWINLCDIGERLTDGGLEDWADAEDLIYWTEQDGGAIGEGVFQEGTIVHSGIYSAELLTTAGGDYAKMYQDFSLTPGSTCKLTVWYIRPAHAQSNLLLSLRDVAEVNISLDAAGEWAAAGTSINLPVVAVWTKFEVSFITHAGYSNYRIKLHKNQSGGAAMSFYVDDISVKQSKSVALGVYGSGNYLESASVSLGGASMTPNPVEGVWGATIYNEDGIFHPQHPTSAYKDWLKTERLVRISVGATYGGNDYYWQRIIGYMNVPKYSTPDYTVAINGGDYMKRLRETELKKLTNYWGGSKIFNSIGSDGLTGVELYAELDAMDTGVGEAGTVAPWNDLWNATFVAFVEGGAGSTWAGKMVTTAATSENYVANPAAFTVEAGKEYKVNFWYKRNAGDAQFAIHLFQFIGGRWEIVPGWAHGLISDDWVPDSFYFTALANGAVKMVLYIQGAGLGVDIGDEFWIDQISVRSFVPYWTRYYSLVGEDPASTGPYYVTLNPIRNGAFIANVDEWTAVDATLTNEADGQVGNCMQVASSGDALGKAYQDITTVVGETYELSLYFKKGTSATGKFMIGIVADEDSIYDSGPLSDAAWTAYSHTFVATATITRITSQTTDATATKNSRFDEIILNPIDVWQGEGDEEWKYAEIAEPGPDPPAHPAKIVYFNINKTIATGVDNLVVHYFTQQIAEDVVADLLVLAGLYVDQAAALAAMDSDAGATIDRVWFEAGSTCLDAIRKICERCDYRFYFRYDGTPVFKAKPAAGEAIFTFTDPKHIASISTYQDRNEIKNRILINGLKQSETVGKEETLPSDLRGEASDSTSIADYGERTLTINNHLFQTQAAIDAMCASLLAEYKDPKWYSDLEISFNPVPLELGDNIQWKERLSPTLNITQTGIIRDIKISNYHTTYKCELP